MNTPKRGFEVSEYENRLDNIQRLMFEEKMDAILLTTQVDIEYYTGFKSQFFQSPTRPWYVLIPSSGKPKAIIPTIGESGMRDTWIEDIQTWTSPNPEDDGISILLSTIKSLMVNHKSLGVPKTLESTLRMPLEDYETLINNLPGIEIKDANKIMRRVRFVKSKAEIDKIRHICQITSQGFIDLEGLLRAGESEQENCRRFKQHLLKLGVDDSPYIVSGSGQEGYGSIIMGQLIRLLKKVICSLLIQAQCLIVTTVILIETTPLAQSVTRQKKPIGWLMRQPRLVLRPLRLGTLPLTSLML